MIYQAKMAPSSTMNVGNDRAHQSMLFTQMIAPGPAPIRKSVQRAELTYNHDIINNTTTLLIIFMPNYSSD